MHLWKLFAILAPVVLLIDCLWLGAMKGFYLQEIGDIARRNGDSLAPRWGAAAIVYIIIPAGLIWFVRPLAGADASSLQALLWGAVFGVTLYGLYDMTNLATLEKWTVRVAVVDILWGGVLCGLSAWIMQSVDRWLSK